jgi:hypothetical protein
MVAYLPQSISDQSGYRRPTTTINRPSEQQRRVEGI